MNTYKTDINGALIDTTPLFASVWLALFNVLRKKIIKRRLANAESTKNMQAIEKSNRTRNSI